jgi:hypothetical protein
MTIGWHRNRQQSTTTSKFVSGAGDLLPRLPRGEINVEDGVCLFFSG